MNLFLILSIETKFLMFAEYWKVFFLLLYRILKKSQKFTLRCTRSDFSRFWSRVPECDVQETVGHDANQTWRNWEDEQRHRKVPLKCRHRLQCGATKRVIRNAQESQGTSQGVSLYHECPKAGDILVCSIQHLGQLREKQGRKKSKGGGQVTSPGSRNQQCRFTRKASLRLSYCA